MTRTRWIVMTWAVILAAACGPGCGRSSTARGSCVSSADGGYLLQHGTGRVVLWERRSAGWRAAWRRTMPLDSLALVLHDGRSPLAMLAAGRTLAAYDGEGRRWQVKSPPGTAWRSLEAVDLSGDGRPEVAAVYGSSLASLGRGFAVYDLQGRETASWTGPAQTRRVAGGDLDGDGREELVAVLEPPEILALAASPGGFDPKWTERIEAGRFMDLVLADLDQDGRSELITAASRRGGSQVEVYRWDASGLLPLSSVTIAGPGGLMAPGPHTAAMRTRNEGGWDYAVFGWKDGRLVIRTELQRFSAGTTLIQNGPGRLELVTIEANGPRTLVRVEDDAD